MDPRADFFYGFIIGIDGDTYHELIPIGWAKLDWEAEELDDDQDPDEVGLGTWEEELANRLGIPEAAPYVKEADDKAGFDLWLRTYRARSEAVEAYPVRIDTYGGEDETAYCVQVRDSVTNVNDYGESKVKTVTIGPEWDKKIIDFLELMELPVPDDLDIGWWMTCCIG